MNNPKYKHLFKRPSHFVYLGQKVETSTFGANLETVQKDFDSVVDQIEKDFESKSIDAVAADARKEIGTIEDKWMAWLKSTDVSIDYSKAKTKAHENFFNTIPQLAAKARVKIDQAAKIFKAKKEYAEIDSHLKLNVQRKWESLNRDITGMEGWKNFDVTVTTKSEMTSVKGRLTALTNIVTGGKTTLADLDKNIGKLNGLKGVDPEMDADIDHYVKNVLSPARETLEAGINNARTVYNEKLRALQASMKKNLEEANKKVSEYKNESGVAQMKMDEGTMSSEDRVEAYNKYKGQQAFIKDLQLYEKEVGSMSPLKGEDPVNIG